jgi:xanthine dehydrogenase accessory factor
LNERLFACLAARLPREAIVLASVVSTRGATPRKRGSRMLVAADWAEHSIGGGLAEARVVAAARELLAGDATRAGLDIDLGGGPGAAGVCGGRMRIALRRWQGQADAARAAGIATRLRAGEAATLEAEDIGAHCDGERLLPDPRLLVVGGGHCGLALCELARPLDFELWLHDGGADAAGLPLTPAVRRLSGDFESLAQALDTSRAVCAVLLNRDYATDVAALSVLCQRPPAFLGMMGSRRRIAQVLAALPQYRTTLEALHAPVGLDIGAETPHEIAVSVLAQLVQWRNRAT